MPPQRSGVRVRVHPLGDTALLAELGTRLDTALNTRAIALAAALQRRRDVRRAVAGHGTVTVQFDPDQITLDALAVAIARQEPGIYPLASPGGWPLIGRTSVKLFLPDSDPPSLFRAGDRVKFFPSPE